MRSFECERSAEPIVSPDSENGLRSRRSIVSFRNRLRFEHQLAALVGLLCLALVGATVGGAIWLERRSALRLAEDRLARLAAGMAESLDTTLRERFREIQVVAGLAPLRERWTSDPSATRGILTAMRTTAPDYAWLGFVARMGACGRYRGHARGVAVSGRTWFETGLARPNVGDVHEAVLLAGSSCAPSPSPCASSIWRRRCAMPAAPSSGCWAAI